jgi:DNA-directed RNA polymerase I subunit RPA12
MLFLVFGDMKIDYTIHFNNIPSKDEKDSSDDEQAEGPIVERKCSKCGNDKMSYATLQLRSADEGQTVFYTCTKCNFKETENS